MRASKGIDPVVGWIVCVEGQDKGRDYRIRTERNFIGRNDSNDIVIKGDDSISRERHAIISFNPRTNSFRLAPGDSFRGCCKHPPGRQGCPTPPPVPSPAPAAPDPSRAQSAGQSCSRACGRSAQQRQASPSAPPPPPPVPVLPSSPPVCTS